MSKCPYRDRQTGLCLAKLLDNEMQLPSNVLRKEMKQHGDECPCIEPTTDEKGNTVFHIGNLI